MEKIYEIKSVIPGFPNISVFPNRVVFTIGIAYMKKEETILASTISSVDVVGTSTKVSIKTNDGKVHKLPTMSFEKRDKLKEAVLSILK